MATSLATLTMSRTFARAISSWPRRTSYSSRRTLASAFSCRPLLRQCRTRSTWRLRGASRICGGTLRFVARDS
eukprot:7695554-Lingulodinium_polyedra.AAC.1